MGCEFVRRDVSVAVANLDRGVIVLEIVAEDLVIIAKDAQTAMRADEKVSVDETAIAVAERQFGAVLTERVEAIDIVAGLVANRAFVFAARFHEQIVFDQAVGRRQASRTVADVKGRRIVAMTIFEVKKIVV